MNELELQLKRIQDKLQLLVKQYNALQAENSQLKKDLNAVTEQAGVYHKTIDDLKQQVEVLKITSGSWEEKDKKDFEKRINTHLKEIDRCIALLSE